MAEIKLEISPTAKLPTRLGDFQITIFRDMAEPALEHAVISMGKLDDGRPVLCRIHSECLTGDVMGSLRCDCGFQLEAALSMIAKEGRGALLYMRQEGRGIGLFNKICAYKLQDEGMDTVDANLKLGFGADERHYGLCGHIMRAMGFNKVILMTNNPAKIHSLSKHRIEVVERRALEYGRNTYNEEYLKTKEMRMGHLLHHQD
ncbi:MAG: GTP cyclohydrolase II [Succinivibrio sp.]|nr:GTP cyclohydrolase II [Succinivibrio sp.]